MTLLPASPPEIVPLVFAHNLSNERFVHTDLQASNCSCRQIFVARPNATGEFCTNCAGMMVRTGTCTTCTECGETGGCG